MTCNICNASLLKGEPDIVNSTFPVGVRIEGKRLGGLECYVCPKCGNVTFQLSKKAKEKLDKTVNI